MSGNVSAYTPDMSDMVRAIVDTMLLDMYFALPAKISSYDSDTQYADVKIQLLQSFDDGSTQEYPVIPNVPVKHPRANSGAARIHMPLKPGDDVVLMFTSRSLDAWKQSGGMTDPADPRKHNIADCFALIGGSSMADAFDVNDPDAIEIVNGESMMQIFPDGTFNIANGSTDLLSNVSNLATTLSTASTVVGGPFIASVVEQLEQIAENVQSLEHGS